MADVNLDTIREALAEYVAVIEGRHLTAQLRPPHGLSSNLGHRALAALDAREAELERALTAAEKAVEVGDTAALGWKLSKDELARLHQALTALEPLLSVRLDGSEDMAEHADALAGLERAREIVARALRGDG